jgi:hypothetical protein
MSRSIKIARITFFVVSLSLCAWMVRAWAGTWFQIDQFVVEPGARFSQEQKQTITRFFQETQELKTTSLDELSRRIREQFPSVGFHILSQDASGVVTVRVDPVRVQFLINTEWALSDDGHLFRKNIFDDAVIASLVDLHIPNLNACCTTTCDLNNKECIGTLLPELFQTACAIPSTLFQQYNVSCRDQGSWLLNDKKEQRFAILFHGTKIPDEKVIATCNKLKGTLDTRGALTTASKNSWVADVRFENQIVLFRNAGGSHG